MPARLFLSSGDLVADRRFDFARDLQLKGDLAAAADLFLQATELAPGFASAWFTLAEIRDRHILRTPVRCRVLARASFACRASCQFPSERSVSSHAIAPVHVIRRHGRRPALRLCPRP